MSRELFESVQKIVGEADAHFLRPPNTGVTCCVLVLPGGYTIVGKSVFPLEDFNPDMGCKAAFDDATDQLLRFEEYRAATSGPRIEMPTGAQVQAITR